MEISKALAAGAACAIALGAAGCSGDTAKGAAVGALGAGAAYEYQNKQAMDELNKEYQSGKISKDEYERRKKAIQSRSVVE